MENETGKSLANSPQIPDLSRGTLGAFFARYKILLLPLGLLLALSLESCTLLRANASVNPGDPADGTAKTYREKRVKKARIRLKNDAERIKIDVTGDSIDIEIIAPQEADIWVKGRKKARRAHPVKRKDSL